MKFVFIQSAIFIIVGLVLFHGISMGASYPVGWVLFFTGGYLNGYLVAKELEK